MRLGRRRPRAAGEDGQYEKGRLRKTADKSLRKAMESRIAYQRTVGVEWSLAFCVGAEVGALVTSRACVALVWLALRRILAEEAFERSFDGSASPLSSWPLPDDFAGGMIVFCPFCSCRLVGGAEEQ